MDKELKQSKGEEAEEKERKYLNIFCYLTLIRNMLHLYL